MNIKNNIKVTAVYEENTSLNSIIEKAIEEYNNCKIQYEKTKEYYHPLSNEMGIVAYQLICDNLNEIFNKVKEVNKIIPQIHRVDIQEYRLTVSIILSSGIYINEYHPNWYLEQINQAQTQNQKEYYEKKLYGIKGIVNLFSNDSFDKLYADLQNQIQRYTEAIQEASEYEFDMYKKLKGDE